MQEEWREIEEFPDYQISESGQVIRGWNGRELIHTLEQGGIPTVGPIRDRKQYRRSVPLLVANAFLPDPQDDGFDTPIQLDGDRSNCHVDNLEWRPRWFAVKYHQERRNDPFPDWTRPFEVMETGELFANPRECAMTYGLLEKDICDAIFNQKSIFPTGYSFRFV